MVTPNWRDAPIESMAQDTLGRSAYAVHAASLIISSHSWEDSTVFGLTGPWGSGKSSMLAMIVEELQEARPDWHISRFTPWATNDVDGLLKDFFDSLAAAVPKKKGTQLRKALATLAQVAAPAAPTVPLAGKALTSWLDLIVTKLTKPTPWDIAFQIAVKELRKLATPVLLIADDIDRLQPDELLALLKVVRLLGRFPGVQYILAYDDATLSSTLSEANITDNGNHKTVGNFMEKIVQYPLTVPPLLSAQLVSRLESGIGSILAENNRSEPKTNRLGELRDVYLSQLSTPRSIDRYLAQLRHHFPLISDGEIDDEDVIVITLLRTLFPSLYAQLPRWRNELVSGHTGELKKTANSKTEFELFDITRLLESVPASSHQDAERLLHSLFPKLRHSSLSLRASGPRGVADKDYFDRYFVWSIPSHDVSDREVYDAVVYAIHGDSSKLSWLLTDLDTTRVMLVLDKGTALASHFSGQSSDAERLTLIGALLALLDQVPDTRGFFTDPRTSLSRWASSILPFVSNQTSATEVLHAIQKSPELEDEILVILNMRQGEEPKWLKPVILDLSQRATTALMNNFRARDDARHINTIYLMHFLQSQEQHEELVNGLTKGVVKHEFLVEDIAARFVTRSQLMGTEPAPWRLSEVDQGLYDIFAPQHPNPWYQAEKTEVDETDLSWSNRRFFARGRIRQPQRGEAFTEKE